MIKTVAVRFRTGGKIYYFAQKDFKVSKGQHVIVETARDYIHTLGGFEKFAEWGLV